MRRPLLAGLLVIAVLAGGVVPAEASAAPPLPETSRPRADKHRTPDFAPGRVLVRLADAPDAAAAVARDHNLAVDGPVGRTGFVALETRGRSAQAVREALGRDRRVVAATLDYRRRPVAAPNDPLYTQHQAGYLTGAGFGRAWDSGAKAASTQKIAVIDTGVDLDHPDLVAALLPGKDVFGPTGDNNPQDEDPEGHGTMVAGMAAATTDNGIGIAGASWGAKIIPIRALGLVTDANGEDFIGGNDSDIAEGITWAVDNGATVVNLSLGGSGTSPALDAAVDYAVDRNVVVVAASGNDGVNAEFFPAAHSRALAVGASDAQGALLSFSNYGPWVDIVAPGRRIAGTNSDVANPYKAGAGTSYASPLVSAAAAIVRTRNPSWTAAQVVAHLQATASDRGPAGVDDYYGWGFLDVARAVGATPTAAVGPQGVDAAEPNDVPARAVALTTAATAGIGPEGDEDWYRVDVATPTTLTITVTPAADSVTDRFAMDAVMNVYGPGGADVGSSDRTSADEPETLTVNATTTGSYLVRVWNFHASVSPSTYSITVTRGLNLPDVDGTSDHVWVSDTNIANGATAVPASSALSVTFREAMDATSFAATTVQLVDGSTDTPVATTRSYNATTRVLTVTPTAGLAYLRPYHLRVSRVKDTGGLNMWFDELVYFTTAAAPPPPPTTTTSSTTTTTSTTTTLPPTTTTTSTTTSTTTTTVAPTTTTTVPPTTTTTSVPPTTTTTQPPPAPQPRSGYWMADQVGNVYAFGDSRHLGGLNGTRNDVVDIEPTPDGNGYWLLTARGEVFAYGTARHLGQPGALPAGETATSMSAHPGGAGYWVFTTKGRAMPFGGAPFHGHMLGVALNGPVLDSVATPDGGGYYMVASDGGIFAFGNARFRGSMGGHRLNAPVQSLVPDGDNDGYWLVASDGGVFAFSSAFRGSMGSSRLNRPVTGMVRFGDGYLMVGEDGGIFNFSSKPFHGSLGSSPPPTPVVAVAALG